MKYFNTDYNPLYKKYFKEFDVQMNKTKLILPQEEKEFKISKEVKENLYNEDLGMYISPSETFTATIRTAEQRQKEKEEKIKVWDTLMINTVKNFESQSKCAAKHVCCLIVKETEGTYNILSIGLNGTPKGQPNCNEIWERGEEKGVWYKNTPNGKIHVWEGHSRWSEANEIHAEVNALAKCNQNGISAKDAIAYISYSPCLNCSKMLVAFGIRKVVFINKYDNFESDVEGFLTSNGVEVIQHDGEKEIFVWKPNL